MTYQWCRWYHWQQKSVQGFLVTIGKNGTNSTIGRFADSTVGRTPNVAIACVRGSPMVPLVGNICTIGTNLITNGTIGKEIGAKGKNGNAIGTNGTNVTNQWYHWENPEHTHRQQMMQTDYSVGNSTNVGKVR